MSKRRFEMYQYRQALVRMRQGDADRDIERSGLMGRKKLSRLRKTAQGHGWLLPDRALPEDAELAAVFKRGRYLPVAFPVCPITASASVNGRRPASPAPRFTPR
jgi:hypothetical protein